MASHSRLNRGTFLGGAAATGAAGSLGLRAPAVLAQSKAPLKIGVVNSFSKVFASLGNNNLNGMMLHFDRIGNQIAGRKVVVIHEDDEINPQVGLEKLKKLVESDKCDIVCGMQSSGVMMAAVDYLRQSKQFFICSGAGTTALSYVKVPTLFRVSTSGWQNHFPMGEWYYANVAKEAVLSASDFAGGRDVLREFKLGFVGKGGKVIKDIYPPLGTSDFSAYLADIKSLNPPGTFHFYAGTDAVRFVKQWAQFGLKGKVKMTSSGFMVESDVLPAQGADALGITSSLHYSSALDTPENRRFVADYRAKYHDFPSVYSEYGYVCARAIEELVKATGGNTSDSNRMTNAMLGVKFAAPRGPFAIDPNTHNVVNNCYIREVADLSGQEMNKVITTIRNLHEPTTAPA